MKTLSTGDVGKISAAGISSFESRWYVVVIDALTIEQKYCFHDIELDPYRKTQACS